MHGHNPHEKDKAAELGPLAGHGTRPMGDEPSDAITAGHEVEEVRVSPFVKFFAILGVSAFFIFVAMFILFRVLAGGITRAQQPLPALVAANQGRLPPEPRLQIYPLEDYRIYRAAQDSLLKSYGWVNRDSGIVRIPIDRAMEIVASRSPSPESGRLPPPGLRLRPPLAPVVPAPATRETGATHRVKEGGQ